MHETCLSVTHLSDLHAGKLGLTGLVGEGCSCFSIVSLTSSWWVEGREEKGKNYYTRNAALKPSRTKRDTLLVTQVWINIGMDTKRAVSWV